MEIINLNMFIEILLIAVGLSMDAVCVSMSNGMCYKSKLKQAFLIAFSFGIFQGIMPLIGYFAGSLFSKQISTLDHWIALILLALIGGKMIIDAIKEDDELSCKQKLTFKLLFMQAVATSIDALAVGISFAALNINIYIASSMIALTTFIFSFISVFIGKKLGTKLNQKAGILGGTILVLIGLKIFIEHMFF